MMYRFVQYFLIIALLVQCSPAQKIANWEKKKQKWLSTLSTSEEDYHCVVSIKTNNPNEEDKEKLIKKARLLIANKILSNQDKEGISEGIFSRLKLDENRLKLISRSRSKLRADKIESIVEESVFYDDSELNVSYMVNKSSHSAYYQRLKGAAITESIRLYRNALNEFKPQAKANILSESLIAIQDFLGEEVAGNVEGKSINLDKEIYNRMLSLRNELSIETVPVDTILLEKQTDYTSIIDFKVNNPAAKASDLEISIDVAGLRQEKVVVSEYSILVGNLPPILNNPWVTLRSDLYKSMRAGGNELVQLVYASFSPIQKRVRIVRVSSPAMVRTEVLELDSDEWNDNALKMLRQSLSNAHIVIKEEEANVVLVIPRIKMVEEQKSGYTKIRAQWFIKVGSHEIVGPKLVTTKMNKEAAQDNLLERLNEQLQKDIIQEIIQYL